MVLPKPRIGPFEINLNTIVVLVGFAGGLIAWGYTFRDIEQGRIANAAEIERLDKRVTSIEVEAQRLDTMELRLANVEKQATDAATAMRAVESAISSLSSDIRVVREILQRLEASERGRPP